MAQNQIRPDSRVLVVERDNGVVGLDLVQMTYYHIAQGELSGEPWLVSF